MTPPTSPYRPYPVLAIVGPTGSGKSELAIFLARQLGGEIVSCDSVQVYRELNVGSAKSPLAERAGVPHHLIDAVSFREELTAGEYSRLARQAVAEISSRHKLPVVAGGTGFYLRALFEGLSPAPKRSPALRTRLVEAENRRTGILHRLLTRLDRSSAARVHPRDVQKLIRTIEIGALAGHPASLAQSGPRDTFSGISLFKIGLNPDRQALRNHLDARTEKMFRNGLIEETQQLVETVCSESLPRSLKSLGYDQAVRVVLNGYPLAEAIEETKVRTRQYAKRQMTWFRADKSIRWLNGFGSDTDLQQSALDCCVQFLSGIPAYSNDHLKRS